MSEKMWGDEPFWGLGYDWDPDWILTDRQKELRETLISLCEKEMRANAKRSDDELLFPRRNLELLGEHGFLGLTVPEEYGGLGENHVAFAGSTLQVVGARLKAGDTAPVAIRQHDIQLSTAAPANPQNALKARVNSVVLTMIWRRESHAFTRG